MTVMMIVKVLVMASASDVDVDDVCGVGSEVLLMI